MNDESMNSQRITVRTAACQRIMTTQTARSVWLINTNSHTLHLRTYHSELRTAFLDFPVRRRMALLIGQ
jgi:hypothetical protein